MGTSAAASWFRVMDCRGHKLPSAIRFLHSVINFFLLYTISFLSYLLHHNCSFSEAPLCYQLESEDSFRMYLFKLNCKRKIFLPEYSLQKKADTIKSKCFIDSGLIKLLCWNEIRDYCNSFFVDALSFKCPPFQQQHPYFRLLWLNFVSY